MNTRVVIYRLWKIGVVDNFRLIVGLLFMITTVAGCESTQTKPMKPETKYLKHKVTSLLDKSKPVNTLQRYMFYSWIQWDSTTFSSMGNHNHQHFTQAKRGYNNFLIFPVLLAEDYQRSQPVFPCYAVCWNYGILFFLQEILLPALRKEKLNFFFFGEKFFDFFSFISLTSCIPSFFLCPPYAFLLLLSNSNFL